MTEIRVSKIRVTEIRISSNHRELLGAIFVWDHYTPVKVCNLKWQPEFLHSLRSGIESMLGDIRSVTCTNIQSLCKSLDSRSAFRNSYCPDPARCNDKIRDRPVLHSLPAVTPHSLDSAEFLTRTKSNEHKTHWKILHSLVYCTDRQYSLN